MSVRRIIIDTDPGQDDAIAILLALASSELEVLGITVVAGNAPLPMTVRAARQVMELAERTEVPIFAGAARPLARKLVTAEHVHGESGLDGPALPDPTAEVQPESAIDFIIRTVRSAPPGSVTLVALGPLTNIALALSKAPDIAQRVQEIVAIIASFREGGNITPLGDFNCYVDPEAADAVLTAGIATTVISMDVTHTMRTTAERLAAWRERGGRCARAAVEMLEFSQVYDIEKYGWEAGPLHDPCAVLYLVAPELFEGRDLNVRAVVDGTVADGMTVVDWWGVSGRVPNVSFMSAIDVPRAFDLLTERLALLP